MNRHTVFFFNMIEIALALVILAIGLSSVLVLFPIGLEAGKSSVADNNLANVAEQVMAYLQSELTAPANWKANGEGENVSIDNFEANPNNADTVIPKAGDFDPDTDKVTDMDGLLKKSGSNNYYLYRQYSNIKESASESDADRAVDFEAVIRIGWEPITSLQDQYYLNLSDRDAKKLSSTYTRTYADAPAKTRLNDEVKNLLPKFYKSLIVEFSWPADAAWSKREKRVFRMEIFNENFVPYGGTTP